MQMHAKNSEPGDDFKDVQDVIVIYISEFDIFGSGKTIYHVENAIRETGEVFNDGLCSVYVNATCKDGSKLSDLMLHFMETDFSDEKFPKSSEQMRKLKHDEGYGVSGTNRFGTIWENGKRMERTECGKEGEYQRLCNCK